MGIALAGGYYFTQKIDKRTGLRNRNSKLSRDKNWMNEFYRVKREDSG